MDNGDQAGLAQLVERFSCKEDVVGSSPTPGSRFLVAAILVVTNAYPAPERPAYGIYVARLVAALERDGHEVVLAASSEQGGGWRTPAQVRAPGLTRPRRRRAASRPDVVWGHYLVPTGTIARRAARSARVPYALTAHGTDVANAERSPRIRKATLKAVGGACAVFAVSDDLAVRLEAVAGPLGDRLHIVSAGVDLEAFVDGDAEVAAAALGWDCGRAARRLRRQPASRARTSRGCSRPSRRRARSGAAARSRSSGDGPLQAELEAIAGALGIADHVRFAGRRGAGRRAALAARLRRRLPRLAREGFGLAAIEALGLPAARRRRARSARRGGA